MSNTTQLSKINEPISILRKIREELPDTVIGGGYFRDLYLDIPFNDIDIYVNAEPENSSMASEIYRSDFWKNLLGLRVGSFLSMDYIRRMGSGDEDYYQLNNVRTVFDIVKSEVKYNIILVDQDPVEYVLKTFDFGICKVYSDGNKIHFSEEFLKDVNYRTLTFTKEKVSLSSFKRSMEYHYVKLKKKFPHHKLVLPPVHVPHLLKTNMPK